MKAVIEGGLSITLAAEKFNIPRTTLGDRISGRVLPGSVSGPPKFLTDDEESELEGFIFHCASMGYGKTRKDVISLVEAETKWLVDFILSSSSSSYITNTFIIPSKVSGYE